MVVKKYLSISRPDFRQLDKTGLLGPFDLRIRLSTNTLSDSFFGFGLASFYRRRRFGFAVDPDRDWMRGGEIDSVYPVAKPSVEPSSP